MNKHITHGLALGWLLLSGLAAAQPKPGAAPGAPTQSDASQPDAALPDAAAPSPDQAPDAAALVAAQDDVLAVTLKPQAGGETAVGVARRAHVASPAVRAQRAQVRAAAARVDQAMIRFLPQLTLQATYTRLSAIDNSLGSGALVGALNPGLLGVGPCPTGTGQCVLDSGGAPVGAAAFSIQTPRDNYSLTASLAVPISDYVFKLSNASSAAKASATAARLNKTIQERKAAADAQLAYYNWLRGVAQLAVAENSLVRLKRVLADGEAALANGVATEGDVLRLRAQVAHGDVAVKRAKSYISIAARSLQLMTGDERANYRIGEDVLQLPPPVPRSAKLEDLVKEGLKQRKELSVVAQTRRAYQDNLSATRANRLPRLDAFGNYTYANPGQGTIGAAPHWASSWNVGARLTWTLNEIPAANASLTEQEADMARLAADEAGLRQGIEQEITAAYYDRELAMSARKAAEDGELAARRALISKVAQYQVGEATTTDVINAENELVNASLQRMSAYIDLRTARVRLLHATGRKMF